jgi:hypothetical protein
LHARLALLAPDAGAPALAGLARADVVLWVTAATGPSAGLAHVRARVRYLVSPDSGSGRPVAFAVAGCVGERLERAYARVRIA